MEAAAGEEGAERRRGGTFAPLREPVFRRIWTASLFSNLGQLILGVGAAWEMTRLTNSPSMVALVQTALMLPLMLIAVPAGAIADMFDRRRTAMAGLSISILCAAVLTTLSYAGYASPWMLLGFCVLIGAGVALYSPSWQASIREQVPQEHLPAAVALGSVSYNVARSFGPALGGLIVVAAGAKAAFSVTTIAYIPLLVTFLLWRREQVPSRLPPERIDRAMVAGLRYATLSLPVRTVLMRAFVFGLTGASYLSLAALVAKELLHGNAGTFGLLLGAAGIGAVIGALSIGRLRTWIGTRSTVRLCAVASGAALILVGLSDNLALTALGYFVVGGGNIITISTMNVTVQLSVPRWVTARCLSLFSSALTGGIAIGAVIWGQVASHWGVGMAMLVSAVTLLLNHPLSMLLPLPDPAEEDVEPVGLSGEPDVALALTPRSGPVTIELDYRVDPATAREFYDAMLGVQRMRRRNGAFNWSLGRDIGDSWLWTERFECPTWGDYLRMRGRSTQSDRDAHAAADRFHHADGAPRIRRRLERPFGSVRWRAETPDPRQESVEMFTH